MSLNEAMFPKWSELQTAFEIGCPGSSGADSTSNADYYEVNIPMNACGSTYQGIIPNFTQTIISILNKLGNH